MVSQSHSAKPDKLLFFLTAQAGLTSVITQIVLLREFLSVFYGNELVVGIILANWMALTGAGSFLGRISERLKDKSLWTGIIFVLFAVLPLLTLAAAVFLKNYFFPVGTAVGLVQILYSSFVLLLPYCLTAGFSFALFSQIFFDKYGENLITRIYGWESLGSIAGGLTVNFVMIFYLGAFQSLMLLMGFNLIASLVISIKYKLPAVKQSALFAAVCLTALLFFPDLEKHVRESLFSHQELLFYKDTPYGNLAVTKQGEQLNFYENSLLLFSTNDPSSAEEAVHFAMVQRPDPKSVLLVSGGLSGTLEEILKYDVERADYVEINPWIIDIGRTFTRLPSDERIDIVNVDARMYIRETSARYDAVLINMPGPETAQLNRYYTVEFFRELKRILNPGGIVSFCLLGTVDYLGEEARRLNGTMYGTVNDVFPNVLIVPGMKNYFLASDSLLSIDIARLIDRREVKTVYVNKYYIDDTSLKERSVLIHSSLAEYPAVNEDFVPIAYYRQILYWLSQFGYGLWIVAGGAVLLVAVVFRKMDSVTAGIFAGGFAASSIEIVLLISFQVIYGYMYHMLGILILIFMAGLAAGSLYRQKIFLKADMRTYAIVQFCVVLYSVSLPLFLAFVKPAVPVAGMVCSIFFVPMFAIGVLVGAEFSIASEIQKGSVSFRASRLYGMDLSGAALGALVTTAILIPLAGLIKVCFIVGLLSAGGGIIAYLNRGKYSSA